MPRAAHVPVVRGREQRGAGARPIRSASRAAGEGGSTGAPPAIINAIVDALREFGVRDVPMPATSERIWRAIQDREDDVSDFVRCEQPDG